MDNCNPNSCPLEPRVEALEKANEQHSKTHREIFRRMNEVERDNAVQNANFNALTERLSGIDGTMKTLSSDIADARREISAALREISGISGKTKELEGLGEDVEEIKKRPGKRWETFGDKILWFIAEAVLIIAAVKIGLM